jgi:citrate lyase subunit beta/citryl-CoA lyase
MGQIDYIRTALFVPGNRPDRVDKAVSTNADIVIIDLEDAVPMADKKSTRQTVREKVATHEKAKIMVRINALDTGLAEDDLEAVVVSGLDFLLLPKVEVPDHIHQIHSMLLKIEKAINRAPGSVSLLALIETALGVENAYQIASTATDPARLYCLAFGAADYTLDMGIRISSTGEELCYPRTRIAVASRAAGIKPPLDTPFMTDLKDQEALEEDILRGKNLGFGGKLCIHPNQIEICNRLYSPGEEEIKYAAKVIDAFDAAEADGRAAIQVDGKFIDYPIVAKSRRILQIAAAMGLKVSKR